MDSASFIPKRFHIIRVDPGEDVLASIEQFLTQADVRQAVVIGGYGTLAADHLHWVAHNRLPAENVFARSEGGIEILGMSGLVVEGRPHVHVTLSTLEGAYGGHMEPGCKAYVLCEVFLAEVEGVELKRENAQVSIPGMGEGKIPRLSFRRSHGTRLP